MNSSGADELLRAAQELLSVGNRDGAIGLLKEAIQADPRSYQALRGLAGLLSAKGEIAESVTYSERALSIKPDDLDTIAYLASWYFRTGQLEQAVHLMKRALQMSPNAANFQEGLGTGLMQLGRKLEAEGPFLRAVDLNPRAFTALTGLAEIERERGDSSLAAKHSRMANACQPDTTAGKFCLALAYKDEGELELAIKELREVVALDPKFGRAHKLLGQLLQESGKFDEAEPFLLTAIEIDPLLGAAYASITTTRTMKEEDGPFIDSIRSALNAERLSANDAYYLHFALAKSLNDLGRFEDAMKEYDLANEFGLKVWHQGRVYDRAQTKAAYENIARTFTRDFFTKHASVGETSELPIFIVGMPRSGTTLTEQIVSCHPDVSAGGEQPFWSQVDPAPFFSGIEEAWSSQLQQIQHEYLKVLEKLSSGKPRVTDKAPMNFANLGIIHLAFPKAKILHCTRDPVDTALSNYMTLNPVAIPFAHVRENIVYAYKEYRRLMKLYKSVLPSDAILDVNYEELIADQEGVTRRIIAFLGLDWNDACLRHVENRRAVSTPTYWQARQPIYSTAVKRWKKYEPWLGEFAELVENKAP